jgi:two-component system CheB/CheR fusion protein
MHKYTLLVLVFSLAVTIGLWQMTLHDNEDIVRIRFHNHVSFMTNKIQDAVDYSEKILLGCAGLFASTPQVTRRTWREYAAKLDIERNFPGIQGLGFGKRVIFSELASHIRNVRAEGFASYTVKPAGDRKEYVPVYYLEPFRDRNLRAFGYDMFSEPLRRAAMERARDEGQTIVSGLITLVQETPGKSSVQSGFLMYRPIYSADVSSATIDDRRRTLLGYAYIPVRFGDFFDRITYDNAYWTGISVYDGEEADPARLAYTSTNTTKSDKFSASYVPTFVETVKLTVYGRVWTVKFFSLPSFDAANKTSTPWYLLGLGFLASVFLSAMTYFIEKRSRVEIVSIQEKEVMMRSEAQLRAIFDVTPYPIALVDVNDNKIYFWSRSALALFGHTAPTVNEWFQMAYPDPDYQREVTVRWNASLEKARLSVQPVNAGEYRVTCRNGSACICEIYAAFLSDRLIVTFNDITEHKKLEEVQSKLAAIVESADDAIISESFKGIIESWNSGAEVLYGYNANEVIGKSVSLIMSPGHPEEYKEVLAKIAHGETVKHYETQGRRKNGQAIDVSLTISPVKDISGKVISASIIASDITARKEIEAGLEKTRKELAVIKIAADEAGEFAESVINTVREPLIALDQDLRIVKVSRSFYDFFKVKPEDTVGQLIYDLGNKQWDIRKLRELLETILPQNRSFDNYEVEHDFTTIGRRIMLLNARQIQRVSGKDKIILLAIEDITEKKKLEREVLTAKDVAEVANRVKSDFLANMSHELRTPLNSIIGFSEVLEDELLGELNPSQREDVQYILKAGRHLLSLINDILDLAKVESGKMQFEVERISLKEMLGAILAMHREKASRRGVSIDLQMETVADMTLEADERKLKQILFNLLSNAVKFTPDGGSVRIMAMMLPEAKEIEISVEDTGIGIKLEDIPKLFKEFSQLDSVYDKEYGGTGLGLALTKKLVELQGGRIRVVSEFGKGSRFTFVLPVKQERKNND